MTDVDKEFVIKLRDCFNAGYQFPQYCLDNNIKKPLFVGVDESYKSLMWEVYAQFHYDRRFVPQFAVLEGSIKPVRYSLLVNHTGYLQANNISQTKLEDFDKVFLLTTEKKLENKNVILLDALTKYFTHRTYWEIPLLHFMNLNPKVHLITFNFPVLKESPHNTDYEKYLLKRIKEKNRYDVAVHAVRELKEALSKGEVIKTPYDFLGYTNEEVFHLLKTTKARILPDGSTKLDDDEFLHIKNGRRMTANQPTCYKNTIYFIGNCITYGYGVTWDKTMESHLQNLLNLHNLPYRVENASSTTANRRQDMFYELNNLKLEVGDIIFFQTGIINPFPFCDTSHSLDRPHDYGECYPDSVHINENGHRAWADKIFEYLTKNDFFKHTDFEYPPPHLYLIVMVYRRRISQARQSFCRTKNWTITKQSCVTSGLKLAA